MYLEENGVIECYLGLLGIFFMVLLKVLNVDFLFLDGVYGMEEIIF